MNANLPIVNNLQQKEIEIKNQCLMPNTHSTDTEPEADNVINHPQNQNIDEKSEKSEKNENNCKYVKHRKIKNGFSRIIEKLPNYEYEIQKKKQKNVKNVTNQNFTALDVRDTDNNRFVNYYEAFAYVAGHCHKYHSRFTREICRQYLKNSYVISFANDEFVSILPNLSTKDFNRYFLMVQKELKYM